ncbi:MAG: tripartite tricarboxylate transporter substrate binding protein [Betaproteobacteria bacterium]|nr:tripartite tricarboxylate transporter substrate binding protein [Betaproteobacteria bacterium]
MSKLAFKLLVISAAGFCAASAWAQSAANFPQRPIRVVVGFPPGGATDIFARILSQHLAASWGQPVVVDNRSGATGTLAADLVSKAAPDGYTTMMVASGPFTISASTYEKLSYDTVSSFAALSLLTWVTNAIVVPQNSPIKSLPDLIRMAKEKPGQLTHSSSGSGSLHHLAGEVFKRLTGTQMVHVPFKGGGPALVAISSGEVTFGMSSVPSIMPLYQAKRLRPIVVTSANRSAALPDVPTIAQAGVPLPAGVEMREWYGMLAPRNTPPDIVNKLNAEMVKIFNRPDVQQRLTEMGAELAGTTPQAMAAQIANDVKTWAKWVKDVGITAN